MGLVVAFSYDLKINGGALGNGQSAVATLTIAAGSPVLTSTTPVWSIPADNGKLIQIYGGDNQGGTLVAEITSSGTNSSTQVTLSQVATLAIAGVPTQLYWGHDDGPAFTAFQTAAIAYLATHPGDLCTLNITSGIYGCFDASVVNANVYTWMRGIPNLQVTGTGNPTLFGSIEVGVNLGLNVNANISARIATAKIGDTTLQLLDPISDAWKFTPGRTFTQSGMTATFVDQLVVTALDIQGNGNPPNPMYWEYAKQASINTGTGVITLTAPLSQDGPYLSSFPEWFYPIQSHVTGAAAGAGGIIVLAVVSTSGWDPASHFIEVQNVTGTTEANGLWNFTVIDSTHISLTGSTFSNTYAGGGMAAWRPYFDLGGPATIYALDSAWNASITITGLTISGPGPGQVCVAQNITFQNCTFVGAWSPNASVNDTVTYDNCTFQFSEVDKIARVVNVINGCNVTSEMLFQNASVKHLNISDSTVHILQGTGRYTTINNSTIPNVNLGATASGITESINVSNSHLGSSAFEAIGADYPVTGYTLSGGTIVSPNVIAWAVPGAHIRFSSSFDNQRQITVRAVTQPGGPGTSINVDTAELVGNTFPAISGGFASAHMKAHPCPKLIFVNCDGCAAAVDLSQAGAQGKPIYSYSKRTYTQADFPTGTTHLVGSEIWGNVVFIKITVNTAYAGSVTPATFLPFAQFGNYPITISDYSNINYSPQIDLRVAGPRTVTITRAGGAVGALGNDSLLTLPDATMSWLSAALGPGVSADYSDSPWSVTIEIQTDQGFIGGQRNLRGDF